MDARQLLQKVSELENRIDHLCDMWEQEIQNLKRDEWLNVEKRIADFEAGYYENKYPEEFGN